MERFFISTSIPYVNAAPHVGFAMEAVQADVLARFKRTQGNKVFFLSGTDENALKNVLKAEEVGEQVESFVERHAILFKGLLDDLSISYDDFIRTSSEERHTHGAQKLWQTLNPKDVIKKTYTGFYCVGCEEFKTEKDLVNGECPEHPGKTLEEVSEENYFFKLEHYQKEILDLLESGKLKITPESRKNEVLAFVREGLHDLSISRSVDRARGWGVKVPGDENQVMYVWIDALSNYINALGYAEGNDTYKEFWEGDGAKVHAIGKGITRFHAVYWPALLLSAGLPLPTELFVHGYITSQGQKMSKSLGNVIDPKEYITEYGKDAFRYFIAREVSTFEDSDFTKERFHDAYNGNLVNGLGNQVSRVMKLAEEHLSAPVVLTEEEKMLQKPFIDFLEAGHIDKATHLIWEHIGKADEYITNTMPFKKVKSESQEEREEGKKIIEKLVRHIGMIAAHLEPIMPETSSAILRAIAENKKPENLFPRK